MSDSDEFIFGPTFEEMLDPSRVDPEIRKKALMMADEDMLDPINLYNITWKDEDCRVRHIVLPKELTGVDANIVLLTGKYFATGSHKVGAAYSILIEKQVNKQVNPNRDTVVCPSTGNYGIGGAWVAPRMKYKCLVILPEEMSQERFDMIHSYGSDVIATPGCESNVKEIFDKANELRSDPKNCILEQFSEFGNYRFHYYVTGNSMLELAAQLKEEQNIGDGKISAVVSAMGSSGTIACGDRIKQVFPNTKIVGLEPIQCPTMYNVGFGGHKIEGIGDKHVTWIHNVSNMDYLMCIDDVDCLKGLQLLQEGTQTLITHLGIDREVAESFVDLFGISTVCNILGAIKTAKHLNLGANDNIFTIATDGFDRYPSVIERLNREEGPMDEDEAFRRTSIFLDTKLDYILEGSRIVRERWHNQKYFTWVEQQGKTLEELQAQKSQAYWVKEQQKIAAIDEKIRAQRSD